MKRWWALEVDVPSGLEDEAAARLGAGGLGVEVLPAADGLSRLRSYHGDECAARRALRTASDLRDRLGLPPGNDPVVRPVEDERWVERWQASLHPLPLGRRFLVVPGDDAVEAGGRLVIRIVPGMAFGTGEHETTRLAAEALETAVEPGGRWLDLGTGTGVLAVVAARCGAASVTARDIDPDAVAVAKETIAANGLSVAIVPEEGSLEGLEPASLDGIVANIAGGFFLREATPLRAPLVVGGILLATGIVSDESEGVAERLEAAGFSIEGRRAEGEWRLLRCRAIGR